MDSSAANHMRDMTLHELLEGLLEEPFAKDNHFETLNLEQLGKTLEEWQEQFDSPDGDAELSRQRAGFERCVSIYCLILMKLEERKSPFADAALGELLDKSDQKTSVLNARRAAKPEPRRPQAPTPPNAEIAIDDELTASTMLKMGIEMVEPSAPNMGKRAAEYFAMGAYFKHLRDRHELSHRLINKLAGQGLCFALETEGIERTAEAVARFWPKREAAIRALLDNGNRKFELHPSLKKGIDQWGARYSDWLLEGKFPHAAILSSLRYMLATLQPEKYQPSLIETGMLILFFGQNSSAHGFPLQNFMGVSGLEEADAVQFMFRMSRMHRLKNRVISPVLDIDDSQLELMEKDVQVLLGLLAQIRFSEDPGSELRVA